MAGSSHDEDPKWLSTRSILWAMVPGLGLQRAMRDSANPLAMLRSVFSAFAAALVLIGVVVLLLETGSSDADALPASGAALGVAAYGVASLFLPGLLERSLDCSSPETLVISFRARFFVRIAFADSAALIGFVGFFLADEWWLYLLGALFTLLGFVRLAPTRSNLERDQEQLNMSGCGQSLISVLTTPAA